MHCHRIARACLTACLLIFTLSSHAELRVELPEVLTIPPSDPYRIYLSDTAFHHIVDGRLHVIDGDKMRYLGVVSTAYAGQSTLSPDRKEIYVATTYYSRLSEGVRTDTVDIHDSTTLKKTGEIIIPPVHAMAVNYRGIIRTSSDGRWLYVLNAAPAISVTVVDLQSRTVASEIPIPGCWIILPSQSVPERFSTLCGDGTVLTITLDEKGQIAEHQKSAQFFDADKDPLFIHGEQTGDRYHFVSYGGDLYTANLGGPVASFEPKWSLLSEKERKAGWRPGGYQLLALHQESGKLYVAVHDQAKNGTHKNPAKEIWSFDLKNQKRIDRFPAHNAIALVASQGAHPRLFVYDGIQAAIVSYDIAGKPKLLGRMENVGETASMMELH